ncbi:GtrA family protein [Dactylosporangium fulvum]|uniref:GtrA family protein n=1 Tax=Dactylosporangium fulvum TaxID=53359 RepID=A0ABY5W3L8_9ACTN|nr:GtrA family protein [Dactylosporangium fulvum]UWP84603.1 GtrA family protein [Dactylosporangium fulvum]
MRLTDRGLNRLPRPLAGLLRKHRELVKFTIVGGFCYVVTLMVNYGLRLTVLGKRPVTALIVANVVASVVSYFLNREWSFRTRGGRRRHHELLLYLLINGVGVAVNAAPLFVARYVFGLQYPAVSRLSEELSDFAFGMVLGTALAMLFRLWAYRTWVFPHGDVRPAPDRYEVPAQAAPASPMAIDSPGA